MTAPLYDRLYLTALRLLTKYGFEVTLRKKSVGGGGYVPGQSRTSSPAPVEQKRQVVMTDNPGNRIGQQYGQTLENGNLKNRSDKWVFMDANGFPPSLQDEVVMKGIVYTTIDVQEIGPGGKNLLYMMVLRK